MRSEDEDARGLSPSDLGSCSKNSCNDVENNCSEVSECGSSLLEGLRPWVRNDDKDFRKGDSSVFEEAPILKVLDEQSFLGRKDSGSSILGFALWISS